MKTNRFTAFLFPNGKTIKNRVVVPPMASQTADAAGFVTDATLDHYRSLTQSKAGLIFVEYSYVHQSGKSEDHQLSVSSDLQIEGLRKISHIIQESGALAGLQIVHAGGKSDSKLTGARLLGASAVPVPVKGRELETPAEMQISEIEDYIQWYLDAAHRVDEAGFDLVELHAAHGYGLNQWLSPLTNQRTDRFGGSLENRSKILFQIIARIRLEVPNLLIAVRLPAQDHLKGGLSIQDMIWVSQKLESLGVSIIDVSSGTGGWRRPDGRTGQGYLLDDAVQLKCHLRGPVIGVGGIEDGAFIDQVLEKKLVDFTAVGRAILKDPKAWGETHLNFERDYAHGRSKLEESPFVQSFV